MLHNIFSILFSILFLFGTTIEQGDALNQKALRAMEAGNFNQAEQYWSELIQEFPENPAIWSNRGLARIGQNKLPEALSDYNQAINIAPDAPDTYLNRGAVLEAQGKYTEAIADYNQLLKIQPEDAMGYNNRGNAETGLEHWQEALADYQKAAELDPRFALARINAALVQYQLGESDQALQDLRNIVRKYPFFADARAALTAALWSQGLQGEAESNWVATIGLDSRYKDLDWVANVRRWPGKMVLAMEDFLKLRSS
ncbi:tetratricopeptide repeat protein [Gloeocapsa sp. PCC 73106]|uniref:tetratricopeptide repeat protein n=1 Tax=Gloeocapsa sp. PCC 73106 TaxID=102232 RepID=UPI0002AC54AB|nr:tetratricopeptide repeat protein [Gloeocapsa sp. PCC 73106]ELR98995.1 tetratricopeptide repeat protein [Gloeocapsa sp. PCC 73106]